MDRRYKYALAAAGAVAGIVTVAYAARKTEPLVTVRQVDLNRYAGTWYEIARYPNRFQKKCDGDTTALYLLRDDGTVGVLNSCRKSDGTVTSNKGTAKVVDPATNAKLKVTFFWPFSGDYWILDLAPDYSLCGCRRAEPQISLDLESHPANGRNDLSRDHRAHTFPGLRSGAPDENETERSLAHQDRLNGRAASRFTFMRATAVLPRLNRPARRQRRCGPSPRMSSGRLQRRSCRGYRR